MTKTRGRIQREGTIRFIDAALYITEDGLAGLSWDDREKWERDFKKQVFSRIIQQLNRLGWTCIVPPEKVKQYSLNFARSMRYCVKGNLQGDLQITGRCIEFKMFQSVNTPTRPDHGGRYESDKEMVMPYLIRLEMERTRRRIKDYLCNVFTGYRFDAPKKERGFGGITAREWVKRSTESCWHYDKNTGRRRGEESPYNNRSADGLIVEHGKRVWFSDYKGRICTGISHYNINNMWWVITGKYGLRNLASFEIYVKFPGNIRVKRNQKQRAAKLNKLLNDAVSQMNFERAIVLRNLLHQDSAKLVSTR